MRPSIHCADCLRWLRTQKRLSAELTFLDPPFNQGHFYRHFNDRQEDAAYWKWMTEVLAAVHDSTAPGGAVYFMQREKNSEHVLAALRESGWHLQNLLIWKKMTSAVPSALRFGKQYQVIAYATKGARPRVFNKLRINLPVAAHHKVPRKDGVFVTDVWDDIRELTSGYYAGSEPLRTAAGARFHKEQSPVALLARIVLSSSLPGDVVLDPFAGTGTTLVTARQLDRKSIGIEVDAENVSRVRQRLAKLRPADDLGKLRDYYCHTPNIDAIWGGAPPLLAVANAG